MSASRRSFIKTSMLGVSVASGIAEKHWADESKAIMKPKALAAGDTIGLVSPAGITYETVRLDIIEETLDVLGLKMKLGEHVMDRWGYFAGTDENRAADLNRMFADDAVDGIFALHGGWGSARVLDHLDYDVIQQNPKVFLGYSDITALLLAMYARTGLVTFHGPNGNSIWNTFSADYLKELVFNGAQVRYSNPVDEADSLAPVAYRTRTIHGGKASGRLVGGNLTVLTAILGSNALPDWENHILFLEDIGEAVYRVDRMMTQLKLAGVLDKISGFVFGACTDCKADSGYSSFTLNEVIDQHIKPLGIPAYTGAMIGHIKNKFTIPVGVSAEVDADRGTIRLLEAAVM